MLKRILRETVFVEACLCLWTLYWCLGRLFCVQITTVTVKHKWSDRLGLWLRLFFLINPLDVHTGRGRFDFWYFAADNRFLNPLAIRALYADIFKAAVVSCGRLLCVYVLLLLIFTIFDCRTFLVLDDDRIRLLYFRLLNLQTFFDGTME
jgi:hypothetical protein